MRALWIAICVIGVAIATFAQSGTGTIAGTVMDRIGHKIANAPIEARNTGTGADFKSASGDGGEYTLSLPAGKYDFSVEAAGHRYIQQGIVVAPERPLRIDVTLAIP
ncbi:MAG: carboxypeptidase regulatory-like domain-containing protein [Acidobacteriia bacterium]|nr:carboxypeptidase regulatory-like domain-containing protein [Terriglobia bacterium]